MLGAGAGANVQTVGGDKGALIEEGLLRRRWRGGLGRIIAIAPKIGGTAHTPNADARGARLCFGGCVASAAITRPITRPTGADEVIAKLQDAMRVISANVGQISSGADEISGASDDLSRRTEQQAASLEQTAAALDEITATVRKSAEGANDARAAVLTARTGAGEGGKVVEQAIAAMGGIEKSSAEITQIIGVEFRLWPIFGPTGIITEIPIEFSLGRSFRARRVDLATIESRALLRIRQQGVRDRNCLEAIFGRGLSRIEVGMVQLGELAICRLNISLRGRPRDTKRFVWILHTGIRTPIARL